MPDHNHLAVMMNQHREGDPHTIVPNILAQRYASKAMKHLWSPTHKIRLERHLWVTVLRLQVALGVPVPDAKKVIEDYLKVIEDIQLESLEERERRTRHDVKAKIDEFNALAGHEHIHKGMTSRDLTENVEQMQIRQGLQLVRDRMVAALVRLSRRATDYQGLVMVGRTHNVPAQTTTLAKRFANVGEELLVSLTRIEDLLDRYPLRGLQGPVGTEQDQLDLLEGDTDRLHALQNGFAHELGFKNQLFSVGQVYPRSLDLDVVSALLQAVAPASNFATTMRLMAGHELVTEGFKKGQVGSSAMPHKMNARSCERINGFKAIVSGYLAMVTHLAGSTWNEGDVSCSVVRRVAIPDAFLAVDGCYETWLTVLDEMGAYPAVIAKELDRYLPFLATTKILMAAVKAGVGRKEAHEVIQKHAVAVALEMREEGRTDNDLFTRLQNAPQLLNLPIPALEAGEPSDPYGIGNAPKQLRQFVARVAKVVAKHPNKVVEYTPESIL